MEIFRRISLKKQLVDARFDADLLDLGRVGIIPIPQKMATKKGKKLASKTNRW